MKNTADTIKDTVLEVFDSLETNRFTVLGENGQPMWERPVVGIAAGDDPYYDFLKRHIGPFHWSPSEVFALKYEAVPASKLRVISIIFPQAAETKRMQKKATVFPCDRWLVSRGEWERFIRGFCEKLEAALDKKGIRAAAVDLRKEFSRMTSENLGIASKWSHRHSAFAAGLGTFGLSDGFISEKGKAIRITSVITESDAHVTPRGDRGPYDWCLYYSKGTCGACIKRCPAGAITSEGHDKDICSGYESQVCEKYWPAHIERCDYIFGCGICQAGVPCMSRRP